MLVCSPFERRRTGKNGRSYEAWSGGSVEKVFHGKDNAPEVEYLKV